MKLAKTFIALTALFVAADATYGATSTNAVVPARSTFDIPATVKDGRDPFFPESSRMADSAATATSTRTTTEVTALKVPGISGTPGHMFAIINNRTFEVGEENDVLTPSGRIHLRCLEIHPDGVVVQIAGRIHRLKLESD